MSSRQPLASIPVLDLGQVYDQRYADADFHYDGHGRLCEFFGRSVAVHRHDRLFQIHYIHNGHVHLYLDDHQYRLDGPLCFFTPPGVPHAFITEQACEGQVITVRQQRVWQLFEGEAALSPRLNQPLCVDLSDQQGDNACIAAYLPSLFQQVADEFTRQRGGREANLMALLRLILANLLRLAERAQRDSPVPAQDLLQFHRFNHLVEAHHAEHWPLQHYAAELGLTTARLNLICRRLAGMSSKQMVFERQLQEAKRLLLHSGQSVSQICFTLGFRDPAYFSRFFSRHVGTPPSDYRDSRSA
ncbi:AraC family transcriptional regulator [Pseudomonas sp. Leaf127]|uniref:4-hydroxyphenylacetate catabolism regulatory protein HpaA n=1 Tax=Pseudomonas sp. Leaf127 TaxID=1736267 RepID=UPI0007029BCD|nr:4-hydroxyphenylacetate catabolism regulatory protein HpaA [Pseudomonas sp. Leaf127]KQQ55816.1 AraC family transcriptional regulator [Pseudomonas sp. Leaf127]